MWLVLVFPLVVQSISQKACFSASRQDNQVDVQVPLDAAEGVLIALLGLDLKVEGAGGGGSSGEVHTGNLFKAQVYRRLVHVDETSLQRIQQTRTGFI